MQTIWEDIIDEIETSQGNRATVRLEKLGVKVTVPQYLCKKLQKGQAVKLVVEL